MWLKDRKYLFVVRDRLTLEKTLVDLIDLPYSVQGEVPDFINFLGEKHPLLPIFQRVLHYDRQVQYRL